MIGAAGGACWSGLGDGERLDDDGVLRLAVAGAVAVVLAVGRDLLQNVETLRDVPERCVLRRQRGVGVAEEELAAARVGLPGVGHRKGAGGIRRSGQVLVGDRVA